MLVIMSDTKKDIRVVDLFSGIGGLTYGFQLAGLNVVAGIDNDADCEYGYTRSTGAQFILKDIAHVRSADLISVLRAGAVSVLSGCAPCQPYSSLSQKGVIRDQAGPLIRFAELVSEVRPDIVSMENVAGLLNIRKHSAFPVFLKSLKRYGYRIDYKIINSANYGVPQNRRRLVLLASRLGPIKIPTHRHERQITLRDVISDLPPIEDGQRNDVDTLHYASKLSNLNKKRIMETPINGGSQKDWPKELLLDCHKKESGKSFSSMYGRMCWDKPASTMTTQCIGLGNGRFGHPEQHRAISLREAARIQTFPDNYVFYNQSGPMRVGHIARFIGNAVPVQLAKILGTAIYKHVQCRS